MSAHGTVNCPYCHQRHSEVIDSRWRPPDKRDRRHRCLTCGQTFPTVEIYPSVTRVKALFVKLRLSTRVE